VNTNKSNYIQNCSWHERDARASSRSQLVSITTQLKLTAADGKKYIVIGTSETLALAEEQKNNTMKLKNKFYAVLLIALVAFTANAQDKIREYAR
jgi:hypothetical protein